MGMDVFTELGLYFEVDPSLNVPLFITGNRCSNIDCIRHEKPKTHSTASFCDQCGNPMEQVRYQAGETTPDAYDFCEDVFGDGDYLTSHFQGLSGRIWMYNRHLGCLDSNSVALKEAIELGGGTVDLSDFNGEKIIAMALEEDPQISEVIPAFYKHFNLPESQPGLLTLKFGFIVYYA